MFKNFKVDNAKREEFTSRNIQIPKSKWAYLRNNIDTFHTTGGEGTPSESIPIVNVSSWNKTICGENLFDTGIAADYIDTPYKPTVSNNSLSTSITGGDGNAKRIVKNTYYPNQIMYLSSVFAVAAKRHLVRVYDSNKINVSSTTDLSGWSYIAYYEGLIKDTDTIIDFTANTNVKYIRIGFVYVSIAVPVGQTVTATISNIMLTFGSTALPYIPYNGNTYPYRLEDVNGVLHEAGDLPDGTADSVNWETGEFVERVKKVSSADFTWSYTPMGLANCMMSLIDYNNVFDDLLYDYQILCSNYKPANGTYNWQAGYILSKHDEIGHTIFIGETLANIGILDEDDTATRIAKVRAYIATNPFTIQYKLATPVTYKIKQYGETYGGVVWEYNQKPIQVEGECNVFTDKNITMNFKAVSY